MDPVIEYYNFGSANKLCSNFSVIITHLAVIWEKTSEIRTGCYRQSQFSLTSEAEAAKSFEIFDKLGLV